MAVFHLSRLIVGKMLWLFSVAALLLCLIGRGAAQPNGLHSLLCLRAFHMHVCEADIDCAATIGLLMPLHFAATNSIPMPWLQVGSCIPRAHTRGARVRQMWDECDGVVHLICMIMVYVNMCKRACVLCHCACVCRARACLCLLTTNSANYICV